MNAVPEVVIRKTLWTWVCGFSSSQTKVILDYESQGKANHEENTRARKQAAQGGGCLILVFSIPLSQHSVQLAVGWPLHYMGSEGCCLLQPCCQSRASVVGSRRGHLPSSYRPYCWALFWSVCHPQNDFHHSLLENWSPSPSTHPGIWFGPSSSDSNWPLA